MEERCNPNAPKPSDIIDDLRERTKKYAGSDIAWKSDERKGCFDVPQYVTITKEERS